MGCLCNNLPCLVLREANDMLGVFGVVIRHEACTIAPAEPVASQEVAAPSWRSTDYRPNLGQDSLSWRLPSGLS